jgi:hypothetical protein
LVEAEVAAQLNSHGIPVAKIQTIIEVFRLVASRGVRKGTSPSFTSWLAGAMRDPNHSKLLELWQTFANPATRSRIGFTGMMLNAQGWVFAVDEAGESWPLERTAGPLTIVVNLGHILQEMEDKTGDRWCSTADSLTAGKRGTS